jgi:hypothetical protein
MIVVEFGHQFGIDRLTVVRELEKHLEIGPGIVGHVVAKVQRQYLHRDRLLHRRARNICVRMAIHQPQYPSR